MEVDNNRRNTDEIADEDPIELPPDTLDILNEFLRNKSTQESLGTSHGNFEEDWVGYIYLFIEDSKKFDKYTFAATVSILVR